MKNRIISMVCVFVLVLVSLEGIYWEKNAQAQNPPFSFGSELWQWEQVSEEGFGDLTNDYAWSMAVYSPPGSGKEYLYVGTLNTNVTFPPSSGQGCQIWRTDGTMMDGKYVWECIVGPTGSQAPAGFMGVGQYNLNDPSFAFGARGMTVYNDLLWVGTMPFGEIFVTNGSTWKRANLPGFGVVNGMTSTRGITVYKGKIYAEVEDMYDGVRIFRYDGPTDFASIGSIAAQAAWTQVNYPGFDNTNYNKMVGELLVFDPPDDGKDEEYLYACTWTLDASTIILGGGDGFEIWRTNGSENPDGTLKWECVVGRDNGNAGLEDDNNWAVMSAVVYNGMLYIGTLNFNDGAEIWRTSDGITWEPVELYGFGRTNGYIWRLIEYKGMLVAGTLNPFFGCELWASDTGEPGTFKQININGMDGSMSLPANIGAFVGRDDGPIVYWADQYGVRSVAIYNDYLIVGTASWGDWVDRVLYPATNGNWHNLSGYVGCEIWRSNASLYVPESLIINKTVFNPATNEWIDDINISSYHELRFRCTILNNNKTKTLHNIYAFDILPPGTRYADYASITYPDGSVAYLPPDFIINLKDYIPQLRITILAWNLSEINLAPHESVSVEYEAIIDEVYDFELLGYKFKLLNTIFTFGTYGGLMAQQPAFVWGFDWDVVGISLSIPLLRVNVRDVPDPVQVGENLTYFIEILNVGNAPANDVIVRQVYDEKFVLDYIEPYPDIGDNIWKFDTINPGEGKLIKVKGIVINGSKLITNVVYTSSNANRGSIIEETEVAYPEVGILKKYISLISPSKVNAGGQLIYKILYYNPSDVNLTNVTIEEHYPSHTQFCVSYPPPDIGNNIWKVDKLPAHSGVTMLIILNVTSPLDNGTLLKNEVFISCDEGVTANYTIETTVISSPAFNLSLNASRYIIEENRNITYFVNLTNTGNMNATNVTIIYEYNSSLLSIISADGGSIEDGKIVWHLNKLVGGGSVKYAINAIANDVPSEAIMESHVEAFCNESISANATNHTLIKPIPVIKIGMEVSQPADLVEPSSMLFYSIVIKNEGNIDLTNVILEASYSSTTFVSANPSPSTGNNKWHFANLAAGEEIIINVTLMANASLLTGDTIVTKFNVTSNEGAEDEKIVENEVINKAPVTSLIFNGTFSMKKLLFFYTTYYISVGTKVRLSAEDRPYEGASGIKATYYSIWRWNETASRWVCLLKWRQYTGEEIDLAAVGIANGYTAEGKYSISFYSIDNAGNMEAIKWRDICVK